MKFADRLKFTATGTSAATITVGAAATACRTLAQAITDGALTVGDTGVPFTVTDGTVWEDSLFTITSSTQLTRTSVLASSAGGTTPATFSGPLTVFNAVPASFYTGQTVAQLQAITTVPDTYVSEWVDPATGNSYSISYANLKAQLAAAIGGTAPVETLTVSNPGAQTAGTPFSISGTYANGTPAALDYSVNGGGSWTAATSPAISGGTYSFGGVTVPSANASQTVMVRDHTNTSVTATSASFAVNATATETITVATPVTQTVGTAFNVTGTYANGTPTALDYRLSDDTAGSWTQVASPTIGGGTFSFSITPATPSAGRTVSVRDRNNTSVTATSGSYVVNASATRTYNITQYGGPMKTAVTTADQYGVSNGASLFTSTNTASQTWVFTGNVPASAMSGWSNSATVPPAAITDTQKTSGTNGLVAMGVGSTSGSGSSNNAYLWVPTGSGTTKWYFWIVPVDGAAQCMNPSGMTASGI